MVSDPGIPWIKSLVGDNLAGSDKAVGDLMNQALGYVTGFLELAVDQRPALISIFSLVIITPVVAFYLICDWDRMVSRLDR